MIVHPVAGGQEGNSIQLRRLTTQALPDVVSFGETFLDVFVSNIQGSVYDSLP